MDHSLAKPLATAGFGATPGAKPNALKCGVIQIVVNSLQLIVRYINNLLISNNECNNYTILSS